ncbi:MAG: chemotaxis protein CheW [Bdellovibrionales bacterium]|nr:chemotaxis protein CheW [Bdellovibrionales bacterium]
MDGQRIIQILNIHALFDLENVPKETQDGRSEGRHGLRNRKGLRQQCISFLVGPAKCGLGISEIQEILKVEQLTNSALGNGYCIGVIDLRGTTVPVIDFSALLTYRECDSSTEATKGDRRIIVLRMGEEFFGLLVDSVESIVSYYKEDLKTFPAFQSSRREMFKGCISIEENEDILLLDHTNILSNDEVMQITHGHSKIYNASNNKLKITKASGVGTKRTFITFKVDQIFAIGISEVKEIIECPDMLLQPPGMPKYCRGVLNLRGDLFPIVDAQIMYGLESRSEKKSNKVLIFKNADARFGLVVDSVEAIISINNEAKVRLPDLLYSNVGSMAEDVVEAIQSKDSSGVNQNLLILNSSSIAKRIKTAG